MGARARPNWAVFVGGPKDGVREVLHPDLTGGTHLVHEPGTAPGMVTVHEYLVTGEYRKPGFHEAKARVARFVRTLPGERPAPPVTAEPPRSVWGHPTRPG